MHGRILSSAAPWRWPHEPASPSAGRTASWRSTATTTPGPRPRWRRSPSPGWTPCCSLRLRRRSACGLRCLPRHRHRRRRALAIPTGWTGTCRRSSGCCARSARRSCTTRFARPSIPRRISARSGGPSTSRPDLFDGWIPMVVGDPGMGRFQSFGHLFALAQGEGYRLDRHPTMSKHPVTPMDEADLGRHLAKQTDKADRSRRLRRHEARAGRCTPRRCSGLRRRGSCPWTCSMRRRLVEAGPARLGARWRSRSSVGSQGSRLRSSAYWHARRPFCRRRSPRRQSAALTASPACRARSRPSRRARSPTRSATASPASASTRRGRRRTAWEARSSAPRRRPARALGGPRPARLHRRRPGRSSRASAAARWRPPASRPRAVNDRIGSGLGRVLDARCARKAG